jgi:hypothetical protein
VTSIGRPAGARFILPIMEGRSEVFAVDNGVPSGRFTLDDSAESNSHAATCSPESNGGRLACG